MKGARCVVSSPRSGVLPSLSLLLLLFELCHASPLSSASSLSSSSSSSDSSTLIFAVIGDYGMGNTDESSVARLIRSWSPEFVITLGDNNYPEGAVSTMDAHIGLDLNDFIVPYRGIYPSHSDYPSNSTTNRLFPSPGNHDWIPGSLLSYRLYFSGAYSLSPSTSASYYHFRDSKSLIDLYSLDSNEENPAGNNATSSQAAWLYQELDKVANDGTWKVVFFHHPPFSSARHGNNPVMDWPFHQHGVHAVLAGHDHSYERLQPPTSSAIYFVNGLGGAGFYDFDNPVSFSQFKYNSAHGAQRVIVNRTHLVFQFFNVDGTLIDEYTCHNISNTTINPPTGPPEPSSSSSSSSWMEIPEGVRILIALILSMLVLTGIVFLVHSVIRMRRHYLLQRHQQLVQHNDPGLHLELEQHNINNTNTGGAFSLKTDDDAEYVQQHDGRDKAKWRDSQMLIDANEYDDVNLEPDD